MTDLRQQTIDTYNQSAKELAEYFRGIGPRTKYIEWAFELAGNPKSPLVVEIGCGDGRDAKEIIKRSGWYEGFDVSEELIKLAKRYVPKAKFTVADATQYVFPANLDVVFAFASILHLDKEELQGLLERVGLALKPGGIFYISSKWRAEYSQVVKEDVYGRRLFYFYNPEIIESLARPSFALLKSKRETHGHTEWFEVVLQRKDI